MARLDLSASREKLKILLPGLATAAVVAVTARFLSDHYGAPAMLMALLLGIALNFLGSEGRTVEGVAFASRTVLRTGVALLGVRVSVELLAQLGWPIITLIISGTVLTILFGILIARVVKEDWMFGLLTAGSVAICGASAAIAIGAILPRDRVTEQRLIFTVLGVTVLSTVAMIAYPVAATYLDLGPTSSGVFLGGTIHDVAQVVGAGFSMSEETGNTATLVKLIRVSMLAPVVLLSAIVIRQRSDPAPGNDAQLMPAFVLAFLVLASINSVGGIPDWLGRWAGVASGWLLLIAVAAVGMKTRLKKVLEVGGVAMGMLLAETIFIAVLILAGLSIIK